MISKVVFSDENNEDKAIKGVIVKETSDFIDIKYKTRLTRISKHRIIKIETDIKRGDDGG